MPAYLQGWEDTLTVAENIQGLILQPEALLYDEPRLLLCQELRDSHNYFSILHALAAGRTRLGEIAKAARIESVSLASKYLSTLHDLRLVERRGPVTENPARSRKGNHQYELERKVQALLRARGGLQHILGYGLFARSFTDDLRREARSRGNVRLITPQVVALPDHALQQWLSSAHNKSTG